MAKRILAGLKTWQKIVLAYGVLLVLSHLTIWGFSKAEQEQRDSARQVTVREVLADHTKSDRQVAIPYEDIYRGDQTDPPVLLLLPGGPEGPEVFNQLVPELASQYRLLIPRLPGFGDRRDDLPDYSFETLSVYTSQFLDQLGLSDVNVLGFGLGGANAIYLAHNDPQKVRSLSLVSSIGVQELELLGSYRLNHAVHGVELGVVWLLHNAVPHFGLMNLLNIDVSYSKSHYESDQRPLRAYLKQYKKPMLILHGIEDPLVPLAAAKEHHRIVPQSILKTYNADHDLIETHSDSVAMALSRFIHSVESGEAITADQASPERVAAASKSFSNVEFAKFKGASLLIIMLIIILGTLISEDLTCIFSGLLAARGLIGFWPATVACFIGIYVGDLGLYLAGRVLGRAAVRRAPFKWLISEKDLEKSARWFETKGPTLIFATRFLPGSRMPTYFSAGVIRAGFWMFAGYFFLAASVWTPMLVGLSKILGHELMRYFSIYKDYALWVFLGAVVFLVMFIKVIVPLFSYKGRRLLVSRYRRLTRWEYWSPWILYAPVFVYVLYLGLKHRCMTLFTATNPAIPDSGFVGESKTAILDMFQGDAIAKYDRIPADMDQECMFEQAREFMREQALSFPIALKPDVGERGQGVEIIHDCKQMRDYFSHTPHDIIIQEYIGGVEFGVFYYRIPSEPKGNIFSITRKKFLNVEGDGQKTIQELILADDQAVSMAKYHLKRNEDRLFEVPEKGEQIRIVELGTHARGAIFRDGSDLISNALADKMNTICQPVSGYYFGRFDIKVPTPGHLQQGKGLKIIEANGVTSESTNIYDSKYSFFDAQRILFKQWRLAYEIADQNRRQQAEVSSLLPFLKRVFASLSK